MSDWWEVTTHLRDVLKSAITTSGAPSAVVIWLHRLLKWFAGSWALQEVCCTHNINNVFVCIMHYCIVCVVLLTGAVPLVANTTFGQGEGPIVASGACNGTEDQLMDCLYNITHGCVHGNDMAVRCTATATGAVR